MSTGELPQIYATYEEAAASLRCSKKTISRKVKAGELEARGEGSGKRIVVASLLRHPEHQSEGRDGAT